MEQSLKGFWQTLPMTLQSNTRHPSFIIGLLSFLLLLLGVFARGQGFAAGTYLILGAIGFGAIHWVWSVADVFRNRALRGEGRILWIVVVLLIPPMGGMLYYLLRGRPVQI